MNVQDSKAGYNRFFLLVAGLGGRLYGMDAGIIADKFKTGVKKKFKRLSR